jgi:hypothetical protein
MRYLRLLTISLLALFGCQSDSTISRDHIVLSTITPAPPSADNRLVIHSDDLIINVPHPANWHYYQMEHGLVLVEPTGISSSEQVFDGMIFHIWTQPILDFGEGDFSSPQAIFEQIVLDPLYIGHAVSSTPQAFQWGDIEASYYLLDNQRGHISLIIGMMIPNHPQLIAINMSAPSAQPDLLRQQALVLLDDILIDGIATSGAILDQILPEQLSVSDG